MKNGTIVFLYFFFNKWDWTLFIFCLCTFFLWALFIFLVYFSIGLLAFHVLFSEFFLLEKLVTIWIWTEIFFYLFVIFLWLLCFSVEKFFALVYQIYKSSLLWHMDFESYFESLLPAQGCNLVNSYCMYDFIFII